MDAEIGMGVIGIKLSNHIETPHQLSSRNRNLQPEKSDLTTLVQKSDLLSISFFTFILRNTNCKSELDTNNTKYQL